MFKTKGLSKQLTTEKQAMEDTIVQFKGICEKFGEQTAYEHTAGRVGASIREADITAMEAKMIQICKDTRSLAVVKRGLCQRQLDNLTESGLGCDSIHPSIFDKCQEVLRN